MAKRALQFIVPVVILILIWQVTAVTVSLFRGVVFPTPWQTVLRLGALAGGDRLSGVLIYRHIADSLLRWIWGFGIAAAAGLAYGLAAGWWRPLEEATGPLLHLLQLVPGLAWIPVAILIFGIGETATVFMIAMTALTPIAISVLNGVKRVDTTYVRAARMLGAGHRVVLLRVLLPGALPFLISGLRIGLGNGWRVLVAGEMIVGTGTGLGYSIIQARWTLDYASAFACLMVIVAIGLAVEHALFRPLERKTVERWALERDTA